MASPSSATRAPISSREMRMRPSCRSTAGAALLGRGERGERPLDADPLRGRRGFLAAPVRPDADPKTGLTVLGGHAGHVGLEPGGGQLLAGVLRPAPPLYGPHLPRPRAPRPR